MPIENLVKELSNLNVLDLVKLNKELEEKWGVKASAPVVGVESAKGSDIAVAAEKSSYDLVITTPAVDSNKIQAIKVIKAEASLGASSLADAKKIAERGKGELLATNLPKAEAESLQKKLKEIGMDVELK